MLVMQACQPEFDFQDSAWIWEHKSVLSFLQQDGGWRPQSCPESYGTLTWSTQQQQ